LRGLQALLQCRIQAASVEQRGVRQNVLREFPPLPVELFAGFAKRDSCKLQEFLP
jgi:hypothetical protein